MGRNVGYWKEKDKYQGLARQHTMLMREQFEKYITHSTDNTVMYDVGFKSLNQANMGRECSILLDDIYNVDAIIKYHKGKTAILNFSSFTSPGGKFLEGSIAHEESLCHGSFLYNVLENFNLDFYHDNKGMKNRGMYVNRALYTPYIKFFKASGEQVECDVITCAAPNKSLSYRYNNFTDAENLAALKSRIKFVLDIAKENNVDTLILGAYGCGVFMQDATEVATIFKEYLSTTHNCFTDVVFAVPKGGDGNFEKFQQVF